MQSTTPSVNAVYTKSENRLLAFSCLPSPKNFATSALPPVPNIYPNVLNMMRNGNMKLSPAKGVVPAKLDTKTPSTIV